MQEWRCRWAGEPGSKRAPALTANPVQHPFDGTLPPALARCLRSWPPTSGFPALTLSRRAACVAAAYRHRLTASARTHCRSQGRRHRRARGPRVVEAVVASNAASRAAAATVDRRCCHRRAPRGPPPPSSSSSLVCGSSLVGLRSVGHLSVARRSVARRSVARHSVARRSVARRSVRRSLARRYMNLRLAAVSSCAACRLCSAIARGHCCFVNSLRAQQHWVAPPWVVPRGSRRRGSRAAPWVVPPWACITPGAARAPREPRRAQQREPRHATMRLVKAVNKGSYLVAGSVSFKSKQNISY